ncbi:MAG: peptidoglycan-associated lipoprotein Pal [Gammaproteobacteria bacterium]|nr:peptidoglycan-associated lipoprotein Pal [Gammaproteobacteria bacterium]
MHRPRYLVLFTLALLALAGCPRNPVRPTADTGASGASQTVQSTGAEAAGTQASGVGAEGAGAAAGVSAPAASRIVYFDFDSSEIRGEFTAALAEHARVLTQNPTVRVRLEGHTDERGSPEYNIGLGERRAQAVRRALMLQGVAEAQLSTVSYGEERPAATGQTEEAWAQNRRVEIVYLN